MIAGTGRSRGGLRPGRGGAVAVVVSVTLAFVVPPVSASAAPAARGGGESAEVREARQHFKAGEKAFNAGDYTRALLEFEAGYVLVPRPGFLLNMAHTERRLGHAARARELYQRFLESDPSSPQRDEILGLIADIDRTIGPSGGAQPSMPLPPPPPPPPSSPAPTGSASAGTPVAPVPAPPPAVAPAPTPTPVEPVGTPQPPSAAVLPTAPLPDAEPAPLVTARATEPTNARQPAYKEWWFWGGLAAVAVGVTVGVILATRPSGPDFQTDGSLGRIGSP